VKRNVEPGAIILTAETGTFAAHVARGVTEAAKTARFDVVRLLPVESPLRDARALLADALAGAPGLLVGAPAAFRMT
jgi:hypothetical protein